MSTSHSDNIPNYITAGSPRALRLLMFKTNAQAGKQFKYFDIQTYQDKQGKSKWIAWYFEKVEDAFKEL